MSLTEKTTHAAESVARLISKFKGKAKIEGVVSAQGDQAQDEETAFFDLLENRSIANGVGVQLDGIGEIIGEERKGKSDALYRIFLQARALVNSSSGTAPQINEIADLLIDDANNQVYREYYPAAWKIRVDDEFPSSSDIDAVAELLGGAKAGGVRAFVEYTETDDDDTFSFADGDVAQTDADKGFSCDLDNEQFDAWTANDPDDWTVIENVPNEEVSEVGTGLDHGSGGSGSCNLFSTSANDVAIFQSSTYVAGAEYVLTFTISAIADGTLVVEDNFGGSDFHEEYTTIGQKTIVFTPTAAVDVIFWNDSAGSLDCTIDNIRLRCSGELADVVEAS